jgi:hypothetical protein
MPLPVSVAKKAATVSGLAGSEETPLASRHVLNSRKSVP